MAKFYGKIGYAETVETKPYKWEETLVERDYFGDVLQNRLRRESGEDLNDNINIDNKISVISDPFANEHFHAIRYVRWMGTKWKVSSVEVQYPRLILTIGGVYNENSD